MTRDFEQFPDDDNGNLLWQMQEDGDDLNTGNTGALQKELCEQHFGLSPFINNIISFL